MTPESLLSRYQSTRDEALSLLRQGDLDGAESRYRTTLDLARQLADRDLEDRAFCNLVAVTLDRDFGEEVVFHLRRILTRTTNSENGFLAAYNLARAYELRRDPKKGLFYAGIALERIKKVESAGGEWWGMALLQLGNLLVAESFFDEAEERYREALALTPPAPAPLLALVTQNLGYCRLMQDQPREGLELLYRSYRELRGGGAMNAQIHLDMAFAHLELGRHRHALRHAVRGLAVAKRDGRVEEVKNALYLVGEAANLLGDEARARRHFDQLQSYFPETPFLTDLLLATDIRRLINLRA